MNVLIAGATGLIGRQLTSYCLDEGITVHYLTTRKEKIENKENYKGFYWDPSNNVIDKNALNEVTVIINLAGATIAKRWTESYKKTILNSRVESAEILYDALASGDHMVTQYISASGVSIYPNHKTKLYQEDETETGDNFLADVVVAWERAADRFSKLGLRVAKLRTGVVFAKEEGAFPKIKDPIQKGLGAPLGSGDQWLSWIHINDIASMYLHVLRNGLEGVYNAVSPNPVTNKNLTFKIASILNKNIWLPNVPGFMLKLILGEMAVLVLEGQLVSCKKIERTGFQFMFVNVNYAIRKLLP